jgi:hypothetical protein
VGGREVQPVRPCLWACVRVQQHQLLEVGWPCEAMPFQQRRGNHRSYPIGEHSVRREAPGPRRAPDAYGDIDALGGEAWRGVRSGEPHLNSRMGGAERIEPRYQPPHHEGRKARNDERPLHRLRGDSGCGFREKRGLASAGDPPALPGRQ